MHESAHKSFNKECNLTNENVPYYSTAQKQQK